MADEPTEQPLRNPIRRLSAQEPLGVEDADAPAGVVDDRYASETPADDGGTEPSVRSELPDAPGTLDAPEPVREAPEPATEPRWQSGGTAVRPVAGINESAVDSGKYTVQPNDNLWTISEKVYGTGGYFKALYEHNRAVLPRADRLAVGTVIAVPPTGVLEQNFPTLCPKQRKSAVVKARTMPASTRGRRASGDNVYVVEEGDTLFDIARYELGKASRWAEIYDLNRDVLGEDFDYLRPGIELQMPPRSQQAPDSVTRQGDSRYQR